MKTIQFVINPHHHKQYESKYLKNKKIKCQQKTLPMLYDYIFIIFLRLMLAVDQINKSLDDHKRQLVMMNTKLERLQYAPQNANMHGQSSSLFGAITSTVPQSVVIRALAYAFAALLVSLCLKWLLY